MRLSAILWTILFPTILWAADGTDEVRDGRYICSLDKQVVTVLLDARRPWMRIENETTSLEGQPLYRTDKRYQYDEYLLPADTTNHAYYLRFWKQGPITWHYCWGCEAFKCERD